MNINLRLLGLALVGLCGCQTHTYRLVQPATANATIGETPIPLKIEPLEYRVAQHDNRISLRVLNPTSERIVLLGERSSVIDASGESHPLRGRVMEPHSYIRLVLPPVPSGFQHPDYTWGWGWGGATWGWGWPGYPPMSGPYYAEGFLGPPPLVYEHPLTVYDWTWNRGPVHLRLTYDRGKESFEHEFEFNRD